MTTRVPASMVAADVATQAELDAVATTKADKAGAQFTGWAATSPGAVTFSATAMSLNCDASNVFTTTLTANVTVAPTLSSPNDGQTINWRLRQDGTGNRTMTWPAAFDWPGGTVPTLSTAANAVDLLVATYFADTQLWLASLVKDFK